MEDVVRFNITSDKIQNVKRLLENYSLRERDVLILDEPEIHLHPEWQMKYAEIIVLLQKEFDLTVILTTHSSHFLEALQLYAHRHTIEEKCNYYLTEQGDYGCVLKDMTEDEFEKSFLANFKYA